MGDQDGMMIDGKRHTDRTDRRPRGARRVLTAAAGMLTAGLLMTTLVTADPAGAVQPDGQTGRLVSATSPVPWTPNVQDGTVSAFAEVGDTIVVGGNFSGVRAPGSSTTLTRRYLFAFTRGTGAVSTSFVPTVNGEVTTILPTGDGRTVWIAGQFSTLNGQSTSRLAKVDVRTGQKVTSFSPPSFNGRVHDLQLRGDRLFVEGRFTTVGGRPQTLVAAVDPSTGALDPAVAATFADPRRGGALQAYAADVTPDGSRMVVVGNFTTVNGQGRYQIAVLDLTTAPVSVADWSTSRYGDGCSLNVDTYMRDVDISPDGSHFVVVTTGAFNNTYLCDVAARWETYATGSNLQPTWTNYSGGDTLTAVAVTDSAVYVGGHQRWMNNRYAGDRAGSGAVPREGLAALDPRSGATLSWNPGRVRGVGVYGFLATDSGLWIGSDTSTIAGQFRGRFALMPLNGVALPKENVGALPGQVVSLGLKQGGSGADLDRIRSRTFTGSSVSGSGVTQPGTEDWSEVQGAFMVDGKLFTAWPDATLRVQDYDGTTFGPQSGVPLALAGSASLNRFATEDLRSVSAMFYDRATGRLYFTRDGYGRLSYRSFSPESRVVGGERIASDPQAGGVDWSSVETMFLAGGQLYTSTSSGNLVRRTWNPAAGLPVAGTAVTVSGPAIDGQDWRAQDAFVVAGTGEEPPPPPPTNLTPTAAFTSSCTSGDCRFDSSASVDPDGTIVSRSWSWGDGTPAGSGTTPTHTYTASGTYAVTLTVVDNGGAVASATAQVVVTVAPPPAGAVEFRAAGGSNANTLGAAVGVPTSVQPGDVMVLIGTFNSSTSTVGPPAGWTAVAGGANSAAGMQSYLWTKVATATDPGSTVRVTNSSYTKTSLQLAAYAATTGVEAQSFAFSTTSSASRTTPRLTAGAAGTALLSVWADKGAATTWTVPPGTVLRNQTTGAPSGQITSALADTLQVGAGQVGGLTATSDATGTKAVTWSILLAPA